MNILTDRRENVPLELQHFIASSFNEIPLGSKVVLFSYSKIITRELIEQYDIFNVHNSLLPRYRGLHAFSWAIINGESELGFTLYKIDEGIDSGDIVSQLKFDLHPNEDVNHAFAKGWRLVKEWLPKQIELLIQDRYTLEKQNHLEATFFCKRKPKDACINWSLSSLEITNLVRAVTPPYSEGAFGFYGDQKIIFKEVIYQNNYPKYKATPGQIVYISKENEVYIKTGDSYIVVREVIYNNQSILLASIINKTGRVLT